MPVELDLSAVQGLDSRRIGVAVSGGGDSVALLHLLKESQLSTEIRAVTVDHSLRAESLEEARWVGKACARVGIQHEILSWRDWDGVGNLQDAARTARYRLIEDWARSNQISVVAFGHTRDDIAETFLMRLARQSGIDGLAAMRSSSMRGGITLWRPMLNLRRDELRSYLTQSDIDWLEDPSNDDLRFERVKIRKFLPSLEEIGLDVESLAIVAEQIADSRSFLADLTLDAAQKNARIEGRDVLFERDHFLDQHPEVQRRLLISALRFVSGSAYPPRRTAMAGLRKSIFEGKDMALQGCLISTDRNEIRVIRELAAAQGSFARGCDLWDGFWQFTGGMELADLRVSALGARGLAQIKNWRDSGRPRKSLLVSPALWRDDEVVSAPLAGLPGKYTLDPARDENDFETGILSR